MTRRTTPSTIRSLVRRVTVGKQRLQIEMEVNAVAEALAKIDGNLNRMAAGGGTVMIELEAHTLRCGKQVRLVVGEVETGCCSPDPKAGSIDC